MQGQPGAQNPTKMCKALSSHQIEAVFARIREHTRGTTSPTGLAWCQAGVVGARGRCCPAATVPVAVVFTCGVCCCIAEEIHQNKILDRTTELCHHRQQSKAHSNEYEKTHKSFNMGFWVCGSGGVRDVHVLICTRVVQIGVAVLKGTTKVLPTAPVCFKIWPKHTFTFFTNMPINKS